MLTLGATWRRLSGQDEGMSPKPTAGQIREINDSIRYAMWSVFKVSSPLSPLPEDRAKIVELLKPERIGVELSEEYQLHPEQSTDALVLHHPEATYFNAK